MSSTCHYHLSYHIRLMSLLCECLSLFVTVKLSYKDAVTAASLITSTKSALKVCSGLHDLWLGISFALCFPLISFISGCVCHSSNLGCNCRSHVWWQPLLHSEMRPFGATLCPWNVTTSLLLLTVSECKFHSNFSSSQHCLTAINNSKMILSLWPHQDAKRPPN